MITIPWEVDGADIWKQTEEFNNNAKLSKAFGFVWDNSDVLNEITACNNVTAKYKNALDCGSLNPEEAVPKMVQELKDAGIDTIIAEKQAQLDAWAAPVSYTHLDVYKRQCFFCLSFLLSCC